MKPLLDLMVLSGQTFLLHPLDPSLFYVVELQQRYYTEGFCYVGVCYIEEVPLSSPKRVQSKAFLPSSSCLSLSLSLFSCPATWTREEKEQSRNLSLDGRGCVATGTYPSQRPLYVVLGKSLKSTASTWTWPRCWLLLCWDDGRMRMMVAQMLMGEGDRRHHNELNKLCTIKRMYYVHLIVMLYYIYYRQKLLIPSLFRVSSSQKGLAHWAPPLFNSRVYFLTKFSLQPHLKEMQRKVLVLLLSPLSICTSPNIFLLVWETTWRLWCLFWILMSRVYQLKRRINLYVWDAL